MQFRGRSVQRGGLALMLVLAAGSAGAQVDVSAWPQVKIGVDLLDRNGDPLKQAGLLDALVVREGGKVQTVTGLKTFEGPQSVCLLIDTSGSMYDRLGSIKATAARLLRNLPLQDEVCVADFSAKFYVDSKLTLDRADSARALGYIKSYGGTALYDSVIHMADYMEKTARNPIRVIILMSDGDDNASSARLSDMRNRLLAAGSPVVDLFRIPSPAGRTTMVTQRYGEEKEAIAAVTNSGGLTYFPRDGKEMEASADHLVDTLKSRYQLTYTVANETKDGTERRLDVEFDKLHQKQKWVVRAPEGYHAPAQ